jgi:hypothetical protein
MLVLVYVSAAAFALHRHCTIIGASFVNVETGEFGAFLKSGQKRSEPALLYCPMTILKCAITEANEGNLECADYQQ